MTSSDIPGHKTSKAIVSTKDVIRPRTVKRSCFPIVGIGASAGGLEAMEALVANIPEQSGMAFVIISHLDPDHESMLPDILKKFSKLPVFPITEGLRVSIDSIYVIAPHNNVMIKNGILHLINQDQPHFTNLPIDIFLKSLAVDRGENAVAVILSGCGYDGTLGARDIKLYGGIVVAQDPGAASFDSMPSSVINTGIVDLILSSEKIPSQLVKWLNHGFDKTNQISECMSTIFAYIRAYTKYDFSSYKLSTIYRRVEKQMLMHHINTMQEYVEFLQDNPDEINELATGILIGVTRFFRDTDAFQTLETEILPKLFRNKPTGYCFRIWVPACSTGEEAYSIAIIFAEAMEIQKKHYSAQIFGTDIDRRALTTARSGRYSNIIEEDVSKERLHKYFIKENDGYKIQKEIRSMIIFGEQNVTSDPPFTKVDMISCRNLLIYMTAKLQRKILPMFHYSLKPEGILFLGKSESVSGYDNLFESCNRRLKFFQRIDTGLSAFRLTNHPEFAQHGKKPFLIDGSETNNHKESKIKMKASQIIQDIFTPVCMLVNKKGDIEYIHGEIDRFIKLSSEPLPKNISHIEDAGVKNILENAISSSLSTKRDVEYHNIRTEQGGQPRNFYVKILLLTDSVPRTDLVLVIFEDSSNGDSKSNAHSVNLPAGLKRNKDKIIAYLKTELHNTKESLQASIEELESGNEELQSMNEELQSTNEEIETSKEELNSLNEELIVVNSELQQRIDLLTSVHDDMANLFNSTEIATFFLDNNLCIKRFTPKAQEFIHLIQSDIGRPFSHFSTTIQYDKLLSDSEEVLRTLSKKSIEVKNSDGRWFNLQIMPYRTLSNMIDGVVITLTDVTFQKDAEMKLTKLNREVNDLLSCSNNIVDAIPLPIILLNMDLNVSFANRSFYAKFMRLPDDILNKPVCDIDIFAGLDMKELIMNKHIEKKLPVGFEVEKELSFGNFSHLKMNITKIFNFQHGSDSYMLTLVPQ